jgi:Fe-S-cluster containining protein
MGLFDFLFGPRIRLPYDRPTRLTRTARRAGAPGVDAAKLAIAALDGLKGVADVASAKRVPKGFYEYAQAMLTGFDLYADAARKTMGFEELPRAGTAEGKAACTTIPFPVSGVEMLVAYRKARQWRDFPQLAQRIAAQAEELFKLIQAGHTGKDLEKISLTGNAVAQGRLQWAQRGETCAFFDEGKGKCRLGDARPMVCRGHQLDGDVARHEPSHPEYLKAPAKNVRLPVVQQVAIGQLDKRMALQISPFLQAGMLQLLALNEGQLIQEVGEPPQRMEMDGRVQQRANKNVKHAKKFQKKK